MNRAFEFFFVVKSACSNGLRYFGRYASKLKKLFTTHYSQFTKKLFAFTLAETLIVMGVIGVVAALTLPNLNSSTNNKEKVAKLQKIYQNLEDALGRAQAVYGPIDEWFTNDSTEDITIVDNFSERVGGRLTDFLKVSKNCGTKTGGCIHPSIYKYKDGSNEGSHFGTGQSNYYRAILADGTSVAFIIFANGCRVHTADITSEKLCGWAFVDLSGPNKGKHMWGVDFFDFFLTSNGFLPIGTPMDNYGNTQDVLKSNCLSKGLHCAGWIIQNGNMDYLKVGSDGKCPNGTVLSWENITCN